MNFENISERRVLAFGDSNTYGYDPQRDGRYTRDERYPCRLQKLLGEGWAVIEEGLPGRTAVFDDPITEGMNGLAAITPIMMSHAPLDTLIVMLGTNDTKDRFGCTSRLIALGIARLVKKALATEAWRGRPDILVVCPTPMDPEYIRRCFHGDMGDACAQRSAGLAAELEPLVAPLPGVRFLDAGKIPGVCCHPVDGMHLTREAHAALADALAKELLA